MRIECTYEITIMKDYTIYYISVLGEPQTVQNPKIQVMELEFKHYCITVLSSLIVA